jgi:hypothetical protein
MPKSNFENFDPSGFEELVVALGTAYIGNGLMPFGDGPDGGREATFHGKMDYPSKKSAWDGYLVMQCKQKSTLGATRKADADWAINELNKEMKMYQPGNASEPRAIPDYYIFVTNVVLSPVNKTGGKDRFVAELKKWATTLGIKGVDIWDRDKLDSLLNGKQEVAQRFGLLHAGDLIHEAVEQVLAQKQSLKTTVAVFLEAELRADQYVRLTQAGHVSDEQTPLSRVFVDLRAGIRENDDLKFHVVHTIQKVSDRSLRPSLLQGGRRQKGRAKGSTQDGIWDDPTRFVIIGGPGQGKSTIAQHLAQRHRAALLIQKTFDKVERDTPNILRIIKQHADDAGIGIPTHPRIPFRIVLEQFADALAKKEASSVMEYIANLVSRRTTRPFSIADAEWLMQKTPWLIAFDGLDEVPAVSNRAEVLNAVTVFLNAARVMDADVLVIATTRPQGYDREFAPTNFNHVKLIPLSKDEALVYAKKFVDAKYTDDPERRERILERLKTAAAEEATARIMKSPLQVTIMAALVDLVGNPPRERYPLFNRYYDIVYQREQERGGIFSDVLADYRGPIDTLHDHIGLLLQIEAEKKGNAESRVSQERLNELIHEHLVKEGYKGEKLKEIQKSIFDIAILRLVFIVPLEDDRYGFEVRSLQEFAAARALMQGQYPKVKKRLATVAPAPYWRNTVLFAVGRAFAERDEQQCDMVTQLCRELNTNKADTVLSRTLSGSRLALDILEDGIVDRRPKYRDIFLGMALELLKTPNDKAATQLAGQYTSSEDNSIFIESIQSAVAIDGTSIPIGAFIALAHLAQRKDAEQWADDILKKIWPTKLSDTKQVFESIGRYLSWKPWQLNAAEQVARNSSPFWVQNILSDIVPIEWIQKVKFLFTQYPRNIEERNSVRVPMIVEGDSKKSFNYLLPAQTVSGEIIDMIQEAKPTDVSWLPFLLSKDFIKNPSAVALAEILESLAKESGYSGGTYVHSALPWALDIMLYACESSTELTKQAQRLRAGELGDASDWEAANTRWRSRGYTAADWYVFSDEDWPFTAIIAKRGIVPLSNSLMHNYTSCTPAVHAMIQIMNTAPAEKARKEAADSIVFPLNVVTNLFRLEVPQLNVNLLSDLIKSTKKKIDPLLVMKAVSVDPEFDLATEFELLNKIGVNTDLFSFVNYSALSPAQRTLYDKVALELITFLGRKNPREGILRLLASLAMNGMKLPSVTIDSTKLSSSGRVLFLILVLYGQKNPVITVDSMVQQILEVWTVEDPDGSDLPPMQKAVNLANVNRQSLSEYVNEVLSKLLLSPIVQPYMKNSIMEELIHQTSFRTSGLGSIKRRVALGI